MSKINIQYMTQDAMVMLYKNIETITDKLIEDPESSAWLPSVIPVRLYEPKKFEIEDFSLILPRDDKDRDADIKNSIAIYEQLRHLPPYVLADERFWNWINFEKAYQVALRMMPIKKNSAGRSSVFKDHWLFKQGRRRGLVFGVISRCFFRVAMSRYNDRADPYELTRFVIEKPERFRYMSWRSFSNDSKIVRAALRAEKRVLDDLRMEEKARYFTELVKYISLLGSVMLLDVMSEDDIEGLVYRRYREMVEDDISGK